MTLPHLEVGDYVEMEHIAESPGDGAKGKRYRGPHWFFREADKGYWRSEFVVDHAGRQGARDRDARRGAAAEDALVRRRSSSGAGAST